MCGQEMYFAHVYLSHLIMFLRSDRNTITIWTGQNTLIPELYTMNYTWCKTAPIRLPAG